MIERLEILLIAPLIASQPFKGPGVNLASPGLGRIRVVRRFEPLDGQSGALPPGPHGPGLEHGSIELLRGQIGTAQDQENWLVEPA